MMLFGLLEIAVVFLSVAFGAPSPIGVVPYPDDPALVRAAPADAILYLQWNGNAKADPQSANQTERFAAQPDVRRMVQQVTRALTEVVAFENRRNEKLALQSRVMMTELWKTLAVPGCLFVNYDGGMPVDSDLRVGIVSRRGKAARATAKAFANGIRALGLDLAEADEQGFYQATVSRGVPLRIGATDEHVLLTIGKIDTAAIVARLAGDAASSGLAANPRFKTHRGSVAVERPSVRTFLDLQKLREVTGPMLGEEGQRVLEALGLGSLRALVSESGHEGKEFASRMALVTPKKSGLFAMIGGRSLAYADLEIVPGDADVALALRVDPTTLLDKIRGIVGGIQPRAVAEFDRELAQFSGFTGVDLEKDVLPHCGDTLLAWSAPSQGGLLFTGLTFGLRIHDAAKLRESLKRFMKEAPRKPIEPRRRGEQLRKIQVAGQTVFWMNIVGHDVPFAPAWCVSDTHVLFSFFPQTLKATLKAGVGRPDSMAMAQKIKLSKDAIGVGYVHSANVLKVGYPMLMPLGQVFCSEMQREGLPLTLDALPAAEAVVPFATRILSSLEADASGFRFERRSAMPFNDPGMAMVMGFGVGGLFGTRTVARRMAVRELAAVAATERVAAAEPAKPKPSPAEAEIAQIGATISRLRHQLTHLKVGEAEHTAVTEQIRKLEATLEQKRAALADQRKKAPGK